MRRPGPIERYLAELERRLRHDPALAGRVVDEAADHLAESAAAWRRRGMSSEEAEEEAVRRFGSADGLANGLRPAGHPLRFPIVIAAVVTVLVACWLLAVTTWVLPSRDPAHVVFWRTVAGALIVYAALTFAHVGNGSRAWWPGWILAPASVAAVVTGAALIRSYAYHANAEGYLLLMGVLIGAHGALVLLDGAIRLLSGRSRSLA